MNRKTKGAIAAGAAVVLLLGGAGSYALWSDNSTVNGGTITAGTLKLNPGAAGAWTDHSTTMIGGTPVDPSTQPIVPGDIWEYDATYTISATGKNMKAQLTPTPGSITIPAAFNDPACGGSCVTVSSTTSVNGGPAASGPVTVNNNDSVAVKVTVNFNTATPNQVGQTGTVSVSNMTIQLNQVRP